MELFDDVAADDGIRPTGAPSTWSSLEPSVFHAVTPGALAAGAESDMTEVSALAAVSPKLGQDKTLGVFLYRPISLDAAPTSPIKATNSTASPVSAPAPARPTVFMPQGSKPEARMVTSGVASMASLVLSSTAADPPASPVVITTQDVMNTRDRLDDLCDPLIP